MKSVIDYVKNLKKLLYNNENKIAYEYEISQELKGIFEQWRSKPIYYVDQIVQFDQHSISALTSIVQKYLLTI